MGLASSVEIGCYQMGGVRHKKGRFEREKSMIKPGRMGPPRLTFSTSPLPSSSPSSSHFNPRLGSLTVQRGNVVKSAIKIDTPGLLTTASRGLLPHLSRDHVNATAAIRWVNIPFETLWVLNV